MNLTRWLYISRTLPKLIDMIDKFIEDLKKLLEDEENVIVKNAMKNMIDDLRKAKDYINMAMCESDLIISCKIKEELKIVKEIEDFYKKRGSA